MTPGGSPSISAPVPIQPEHVTSQFTCGKPMLDDWLKSRAFRSEGRSARTYVACVGQEVVGYYCISTGSVRIDELPKKLAGDMPASVPIIILGRLAVHSGYQGLRIGKGLLKDALLRSLQVSEQVGCRAVLVHALDEEAAAFYVAFGFIPFPAGARTLFMPIKSIAAAL